MCADHPTEAAGGEAPHRSEAEVAPHDPRRQSERLTGHDQLLVEGAIPVRVWKERGLVAKVLGTEARSSGQRMIRGQHHHVQPVLPELDTVDRGVVEQPAQRMRDAEVDGAVLECARLLRRIDGVQHDFVVGALARERYQDRRHDGADRRRYDSDPDRSGDAAPGLARAFHDVVRGIQCLARRRFQELGDMGGVDAAFPAFEQLDRQHPFEIHEPARQC